MPRRKHLRGAGKKGQRQYEHIKKSAQKSGRYGKCAKEVAARTVMKQHKEKGPSQGQVICRCIPASIEDQARSAVDLKAVLQA